MWNLQTLISEVENRMAVKRGWGIQQGERAWEMLLDDTELYLHRSKKVQVHYCIVR